MSLLFVLRSSNLKGLGVRFFGEKASGAGTAHVDVSAWGGFLSNFILARELGGVDGPEHPFATERGLSSCPTALAQVSAPIWPPNCFMPLQFFGKSGSWNVRGR